MPLPKTALVLCSQLTFKSSRKTGDYHGQVDHALFTKWLKQQLLPLMKSTSLIVMDFATYHNVLFFRIQPL